MNPNTGYPNPVDMAMQAESSHEGAAKRALPDGARDGEGPAKLRLACLNCRSKKSRCEGTRPTCLQCTKSRIRCQWPDGRRRKRSKREIEDGAEEEARRGRMDGGRGLGGDGGGSGDGGGRRDSGGSGGSGEGGLESWASRVPGYQPPPALHRQKSIAVPNHSHNHPIHQQPQPTLPPQQMQSQSQQLQQQQQPVPTPQNILGFLQHPPSSSAPADWPNDLMHLLGTPGSGSGGFENQTLGNGSGNGSAGGGGGIAGMGNGFFQYFNGFGDLPGPSSGVSAGNMAGQGMMPPNNNQLKPTRNASSSQAQATSNFTSMDPPGNPNNGSKGKFATATETPQTGDAQQEAMLRAITDQVGYIEGDQGERYLKVYYYRVSGSTAIHPGINRICLKLQLRSPSSLPATSPSSLSSITNPTLPSPRLSDPFANVFFDPQSNLPPVDVYMPLLEIFFKTNSQMFPSIQPARIYGRLGKGTMSAFLLAAMCAYAARFADKAKNNIANAGNVFRDKACELLVPLIRLPTTDGVTGLILLSWCEYGQNSESGHWAFTGLAIRMSEDLGFMKNDEAIFEDHAHYVRNKLMFWTTFITDRLLAFSTGRPCAIQMEHIELPLPTDEDMPVQLNPEGNPYPALPSPFVRTVSLMIICGRIADLLNGSRGAPRTFSDGPKGSLADALMGHQTELVQFYNRLPEEMVWSAPNFVKYSQQDLGGIFITLHCIANAVMSLLYHPAILYSPNGTDTPMTKSMNRSINLSLACSRAMVDCITYADLFSQNSLTTAPHITQTLYIAGLAFAHELKASAFPMSMQGDNQEGDNTPAVETAPQVLLSHYARQNLETTVKALRKMSVYWAAAGVPLNVLEQRARGLGHSRIDFDKSADHIPTFVSLPDSGILKRFTGELGLPDMSPANQLATIAALSPSSMNGVNPQMGTPDHWDLQRLLADYSVDETSVEPAGSFDPSFFNMSGINGF